MNPAQIEYVGQVTSIVGFCAAIGLFLAVVNLIVPPSRGRRDPLIGLVVAVAILMACAVFGFFLVTWGSVPG